MSIVRLDTDEQAAEALDHAFGQFCDLLESVARHRPRAIRAGFDLEVDQALSSIWIRHDLPQSLG